MNDHICDFSTLTGKYVYIKIWGQAIEDTCAILSILISAIVFIIEKYKKRH